MSEVNTIPNKISQPVIFFPGTLCDERVFNPCWQYLEIPQRAFVPLQWAQDLQQMKMLSADRLAYFDQPIHLVGFSMGGYLAALTAIDHPQQVASLTLIGNTCDVLPKAELKRRENTLSMIANKQYKVMTDTHLRAFFHSKNSTNSELQNIVRQMEADLGASVLSAQIKSTQSRKNLIHELSRCAFPVHFIVGEQDTLVNVDAIQNSVNKLPNADMSVIKDAGHMLPIEQPEKLADNLATWIA